MSIEDRLMRLVGPMPAGMTEGVALGTGIADGYDIYQSPLGAVAVTFNPDGVSSLDLADEGLEQRFTSRFGRQLLRAEAPKAWHAGIADAIEAGRPGKLPIDMRTLTGFQTEVLEAAATIPRGEVRSYGWLAAEVSRPGATRAAGSVMARNPVPLIIPCHRVVRSDGHIGNYSLGGPHNKTELLLHEGTRPEWLEELARKHVRFRANTTTGIYCNPTCRAARRSKEANMVDIHSTAEAVESGFTACKICRPV